MGLVCVPFAVSSNIDVVFVDSQLGVDRSVASPGADSNDSGIQADVTSHVHGPINDDLYAVVNKQKTASDDVKVLHGSFRQKVMDSDPKQQIPRSDFCYPL